MIGKYFIFGGIFIAVIGVLLYFFSHQFQWFGRLPGDIRIERENFKFYFPVTSMILVSIILTILINLIRKLF
jgi:hypothetical protein